MKLRRLVAGMAAAAMALAMSVVAHADDAVDYSAMGQIYVQESGGSWTWIGSGENDNAKVKPGEEKTLTWEIDADTQSKMAKWIGTTDPPKIGFQLLNCAIAKQEGKEGSLKASSSKIVIETNDGKTIELAGEDLSNDALKPHDEGSYWSGQTVDTNWVSAIEEKAGIDQKGYEELYPTIKKVSVTFKLDSMTPYEAPTTEQPTTTDPAPSNDTTPSQTGAAAGIALALTAVAGAALVVSKKRG